MYMHGAAIIILLLAGAGMAQGVSSLTVGDATYENVTLKNEYPRSFFIQHDGGTAFIERSKLSEDQIAQLLEASTARESVNGNESAEPEVRAENKEAEYLHPKPESLETDEEKKFFEACGKAETATIVSMLKENPALAKVTMKGRSYRRFLPQMEDGQMTPMRTEPVDASCDALQWLIDESEKTPDRIEAIKALVEAGADPSRTTSEAGCNMARNSVSIPSKLTIEELDFLLSKGANPDFGFCVASYPPVGLLAIQFVTAEDSEKKEDAQKYLKTYITHGANPDATASPSFVMGTPRKDGKWKDARFSTANDVAKFADDPELDAILAEAKK
jgi:hypothetical protein